MGRKGKEKKAANKIFEDDIYSGLKGIGRAFKEGDLFTKLSFLIMGFSNLCRKQIVKGLIYLSMEIGYLFYMIAIGINSIAMLKTLGTIARKGALNKETGLMEYPSTYHNSMLLLLYGVAAVVITIIFIAVWYSNIKSAIKVQNLEKNKKEIPGIKRDIKDLFDSNVHKTLLILPAIGLTLFTILPLIFMILMAFTGFDSEHQPPGNLFTWEGFKNFKIILSSGSTIGKTFWPILGWTLIWAVFATSLNYIFGMLLAILINKKGIKFKKLWRTIFVLTIAVPAFVSLLSIRLMLAESGAVNILLQELGFIDKSLPFFTNVTWARVTVIIVNLWVGIPHTMLITTGILMNIPADLYESAKIDGANSAVTFFKITLPYMLFVTTPYLITQFIGNINNFNVIFLLSGGAPMTVEYYKGAGKTDLLVTWLYKLTVDSKDYSYASVIGILIFIIVSTFSLITYRRTGSYKNEEGFQ